jgi:hypothetical protein
VWETAIRRSEVEMRGSIFEKCSQIMAYTDDVVIMGRRLRDAEEVFTSLVKQTNKNINKKGLGIKDKKTKFMLVSQKPYNKNEYIKLGTDKFEIVKDYTYLGTILTIKNEL